MLQYFFAHLWLYMFKYYTMLYDSESELYTILIFTVDEYKKLYNIACVHEYVCDNFCGVIMLEAMRTIEEEQKRVA